MKFIKRTEVTTDQLLPNPKNPREDLGDLTELADSIRENGILQELTVFPHGKNSTSRGYVDAYMIVIGHRRYAAARLAGTDKIPVKVYEISEKEAQAMMLEENMQRTDLTPWEEAKGIQMCLDLGMTDADLVKHTGLSKTTINNRKVLLKYPGCKDTLSVGTATIDDYLKLDSIKDEEERKSVEKSIGTDDFDWEYEGAIHKQEVNERLDFAEELVKKAGLKEISSVNYNMYSLYSRYTAYSKDSIFEMPDLKEDIPYFYNRGMNDICLYIRSTDMDIADDEDDEDEESEDEEFDSTQLEDAFKLAEKCRKDWIKEKLNAYDSEKIESVFGADVGLRILFEKSLVNPSYGSGINFVDEGCILNRDDTVEEHDKKIQKAIDTYKSKISYLGALLKLSKLENSNGYDIPMTDYDCRFDADSYGAKCFIQIYEYLTKLGYKISKTEVQLLDGTFEGYNKKEEEDEDDLE